MTAAVEYRPSKGDRIGILVFTALGIAIVAWSAYAAFWRIMQVLLGEDVPVLASFIETRVDAPIGPGGALVPVALDTARVTAEQLPASAVIAALSEPVVAFLTIAAVVACLILLSRSIRRGRIFGRRNTALAATAGITGLVGSALASLLGSVAAAEAVAEISGGSFDGAAVLPIDPLPYAVAAFAIAIVVTSFSVGDRLQREAEGLV